MPKKNDFKLDVVSVRLVKDAPIYSEHAVMGDCMCQFDREVVCGQSKVRFKTYQCAFCKCWLFK